MKKIFKVVAFIASVMFAMGFISCSNPSSSDSGSDVEATNSGETSGVESGETSTSVDENDPFAGSTWVYQSSQYMTLITTIKFSTSKTVDYSMNTAGTVTSIYSGPYTVEKDFNGVEGQYGALVGSQTFTIPNKDATATTFVGHTFTKK